ncbi:hypothetical protein [Marinobacter sp. LV10R520-4]|uniref:hypothetical protein n=1 Tax=Marinobacter sp. LV10R520-4 TaxID=1761796 RepID=UPI0026D045E9
MRPTPSILSPRSYRRRAAAAYSLKVLLENLLRNEDGERITPEQIQTLAEWQPKNVRTQEIQYTPAPARVLMQDFTGVPCINSNATQNATSCCAGARKR